MFVSLKGVNKLKTAVTAHIKSPVAVDPDCCELRAPVVFRQQRAYLEVMRAASNSRYSRAPDSVRFGKMGDDAAGGCDIIVENCIYPTISKT